MRSHEKDVTRFTFDCPSELHSIAKMKALESKQSLKDYLIGLLAKDVYENPPKYIDSKTFKKELNKLLETDSELMKRLTDQ